MMFDDPPESEWEEEFGSEDEDRWPELPQKPPLRTPDPWLPERVRTTRRAERHERTLDDFIARFTDAEPIEDRDERVLTFEASGYFSQDAFAATRAMGQYLPTGFHEVERLGNAYRTVWINEDLGAMITYVGGDVRVSIARSRLDWIEYRDDIERFYLLHP